MSGFSLALVDASGAQFTLTGPARLVVSLVPSITESIIGLGATAALLARTRYCIHPADAVRAIPKVGGTKDPDLASIAALKPELVLANREENLAEHIAALRAQGLLVHVCEPRSPLEALDYVSLLGQMLGRKEAAAQVAVAGAAALAALSTPKLPKPTALALIWNQPLMCAGSDTYIHGMLEALGYTNAAASLGTRYPELDPARIAQLAPALILLPSEPYEWKARDADALAALCASPTASAADWRARMVLCNGEDLMWFGTRTPDALKRLATQLAAHLNAAPTINPAAH